MNDVGARYGLLLALVFTLLIMVVPRPWGFIAWLGLLAIQSLVGGWIVWSRARMGFVAASSLLGAAGMALWAFLIYRTGDFVLDLREPLVWVGAAMLLVSITLFLLESRFNREGWERWREIMEHATVRDILLLRNIPRLR